MNRQTRAHRANEKAQSHRVASRVNHIKQRAPRRHAFSAYDNIPIAVATVAFVVIARTARTPSAPPSVRARARIVPRRRLALSGSFVR